MIIGIDGGALAVDDIRLKVGVYKVSLRLLENISRIGYSNYYRVYTFRKIGDSGAIFLSSNMEERILTPPAGWQKLRLPLELAINPVNIFLGLSQMIPDMFLAEKIRRRRIFSIGFVYDTSFLNYPYAYPVTQKRLKIQTGYLVQRADAIIAVSNVTRTNIISHYPDYRGNIFVCYPGIDREFSDAGRIYRQDHPYFLFVGALKPIKNVPVLLKAFSIFLKNSQNRFDLLIAGGDYWPDPEISGTVKRLHLENRVKLLGYVPDSKLPAYYRGAVALVSPSLGEGFCLPAAEALACGIPVLGSVTGAMPEVVGKAGILVNPSDPIAIAKAIKELTDDSRRRKLLMHAKDQVKLFSWERFTRGVIDVIKSFPVDQ
jgi:glycosyltransferase involved in cell wall biosynthesis